MAASILFAGALASAGLAGPVAVLKAEVLIGGPELRVRDLVEIRGVGLPAEIASRIVARLPRSTDLSAASVAALVRRRVPGLSVEAPAKGLTVRIAVRTAPSVRRAVNCFETIRPVAAGEVLTRPDVVATPCRPGAARAAFAYNRGSGALSAVRAIPAAAYLGQLPLLPAQHIARGAPLTLRSIAGPVLVERSVTALQSAGTARQIFVRDDRGKVFSAPLIADPEAGGR